MRNSRYYLGLMLKLAPLLASMGITSAMIDSLIYEKCFAKGRYYRSWSLKKKNGKLRKISEPCEPLKIIQQAIVGYLYKFPLHPALKAYIKGKNGVMEAAKTHQFEVIGKDGRKIVRPPRWLLKIDLKDFFPSIRKDVVGRVITLNFLYDEEMRKEIFSLGEAIGEKPHKLFQQLVKVLTWLTAGRGCLLQGAPTSPSLANLVWTESLRIDILERHLVESKKEFNLAVYADDISISLLGKRYPKKLIKEIAEIINGSECFRINPEKTRLNKLKHGAHSVTGISITRDDGDHEPKIGISQKYLNAFRGDIHRANKIMWDGRCPTMDEDGVSIANIRGRLNWVRSVYGEKGLPSSIRKLVPLFEALAKAHRQ